MNSAKPVRGTRDILPEEMKLRKEIENKILEAFKEAGYNQIETPAIENLDLLMNSDGGENLKMLFTITKRGNKFKPYEGSSVKDLCDTGLRFDLTLPLTRYYSNNKTNLELPFKSIQIGEVYRAERPQKGRFRSFKQCDIDIIGDASIGAEIDLIHTVATALLNVGFKDFTIKINDRKLLNAFILKQGFDKSEINTIAIALDKLDKIGIDGVEKELLEKGLNEEKVKTLIVNLNNISLEKIEEITGDDQTVENLRRIINAISATSDNKYKIVFDFSLVRGMGYYTGPVFEVSWGDVGYAIAGGGRYDEMIGKTSKESVPAVGFSIGFERIIDILVNILEEASQPEKKVLLLCNPNKDDMSEVIKQADILKAEGYVVNLTPVKKKLGKQIEHAKEKGYYGIFLYGRDKEVKEI